MYIISYIKEHFVDQTSCMSQILARPITFPISGKYKFITNIALNCCHRHFERKEKQNLVVDKDEWKDKFKVANRNME